MKRVAEPADRITAESTLYGSTKQVCQNAIKQWQYDTINGSSGQIEYRRVNGTNCNNKNVSFVDADYSIKFNNSGKIIDFKITNGRVQYSYTGEGLLYEKIQKDEFIKVTSDNKIVIPDCGN